MKKMVFLMLSLIILGAASMNAQVRIGGTDVPDDSALLDVNINDDTAPAGNLGLGLPRVVLTSADQKLATGKTPKPGTMVYNTGTGLEGEGVYYWETTKWEKLSSGVGPQGEPGAKGEQGEPGPKGDAGTSNLVTWVQTLSAIPAVNSVVSSVNFPSGCNSTNTIVSNSQSQNSDRHYVAACSIMLGASTLLCSNLSPQAIPAGDSVRFLCFK